MKRILFLVVILAILLTGCGSAADTASMNLSTAADNFEITRRIVFYNGITGEYILEIQGQCSLGNYDSSGSLSVTCKTGPNEYKKHWLGLSDNVTYFAEQIDSAPANPWQYRVIFRPTTIIPDLEMKTP